MPQEQISGMEFTNSDCFKNLSTYKPNVTKAMNGFTCSLLTANDE
jgi:hypothetical protein